MARVSWRGAAGCWWISGFSAWALAATLPSCTTVDPGEDFQRAEIVFDEGFFYCRVEPVLFRNSCGPGDGSQGDASGGCHFNVTSFKLTDYNPKLADSCDGNNPTQAPGQEAQGNYTSAQAQMRRDPELAPLLNRPTGVNLHPRTIFAEDSADADVIREWAERFSSQ